MTAATITAALCLAVTVARGAPPAPPAQPQPARDGAAPAAVACADCHDQPAEWGRRKTVHPPVKDGKCTTCHSPHAARHAGLLRRGGTRLCAGCHPGIAAPGPGKVVHGAMTTEKACLSCHDPHASDQTDLLAAAPGQSCAACHEEIAKTKAPHPHPPVTRGECLVCHDPHTAPGPGLARKTEPELCTGCHAPSGAAFTTAHRGIPAGRARCTGCHAPHGSASPGLIWPVAHAPFAALECAACHDSIKEKGPLAPAAALALCTTCHEPHAAGHPVPPGGSCLSCHTPHASASARLLAGREQQVCTSCHSDIAQRRSIAAAVHPALAGRQDCTVCHEIHTGQTAALLKKKDPHTTCVTCHGSHAQFAHPMGEGVADPSRPGRSVGCLSCHDPHGTAHPMMLLADPRRELCVRCHADGS